MSELSFDSTVAALWRAGLPAEFVNTGGGCMRIEVRTESGIYLAVTGYEDVLWAWREPDEGWHVQAKRLSCEEDGSSCCCFADLVEASTDSTDAECVRLVQQVLTAVARAPQRPACEGQDIYGQPSYATSDGKGV